MDSGQAQSAGIQSTDLVPWKQRLGGCGTPVHCIQQEYDTNVAGFKEVKEEAVAERRPKPRPRSNKNNPFPLLLNVSQILKTRVHL